MVKYWRSGGFKTSSKCPIVFGITLLYNNGHPTIGQVKRCEYTFYMDNDANRTVLDGFWRTRTHIPVDSAQIIPQKSNIFNTKKVKIKNSSFPRRRESIAPQGHLYSGAYPFCDKTSLYKSFQSGFFWIIKRYFQFLFHFFNCRSRRTMLFRLSCHS